jgi:hypothetical protein
MHERVGRAIHPFYNGSVGASLRVGQFADGALDPESVGSVSGQASPIQQRPGERMAL